MVEGCARLLQADGFAAGSIGLIGDRRAAGVWDGLAELLPRARFTPENGVVDRMQRRRSPREVDMVRTASQLADIGIQAAYHVARPGVTDQEIYAAFSFAQMARGGETGDGHQIGINEFGTHCGKPYGRTARAGDLINFHVSNATYQGYTTQSARIIAVGRITDRQETVLEACTSGVKAAKKLIRLGVLA